MGGDASRNGAELFETVADFSAKIVTFRLVGGCIPPIPPPKSATGHKQLLGEGTAPLGPTVATALATSTKNDTTVTNFVNLRLKNNKATF